MKQTEPQVYLIGSTTAYESGIQKYLQEIGASDWVTDAPTGAEKICEMMGRLCYRSWKPELNKNVTRVRQGNKSYLGNIISSGHGAVLEHASVNFIFHNVSRVFTHELVRHRAGAAYSQESLRYVRLEDLGLWVPDNTDPYLVDLFKRTFETLEELQKEMAKYLKLDELPFAEKKKLTSTMRRIAPIGLSTAIGATFNHRTLRHLIELRTSEHAEEEIRYVFDKLAQICTDNWPNMYQDFIKNDKNEWVTKHSKV